MKKRSYDLVSAFKLKTASPSLVSIVGGGGKTSLMFALARALPGRVVTTTTTRIFAAQMAQSSAVCYADNLTDLGPKLSRHGSCLVVGEVKGDKAPGVTPELAGELLARADVDYVLVEADGSRMRPIKAPAAHEPVVPPETTLLIPVVGIDALEGRLDEVAHRPELLRKLVAEHVSNTASGDLLTEEAVARVITHPQGGLKNVPDDSLVIPFINKVESETQLGLARQIARFTLGESRINQVVIGAVRSDLPVREVHARVTAVVLAAGQANRMGKTKQLLPWGNTTVLGQTIRHLKQSSVHDVLVVSGHEAEAVEAVVREEGVPAVYNPDYETGEMLSSLKQAVRRLPQDRSAVIVILADQPMVEPVIVDQLLEAYRQGRGGLIAPAYQGRRGNPVLIDRAYFGELLELPPAAAPRLLLRRHKAELIRLPVDSDSVLRDLDSLEDYRRWRPE